MSTDNEMEMAIPVAIAWRPLSLWRSRDYVLLWSRQAISSIGTGVSQFALPLFILVVTRSPALAGFIAAMRALLSQIPDHLQGRVNSALRLLALGTTPVGLALGGFFMQWSGAINTVFIFGGCFVGLAVWATLSPLFAARRGE